MTETSDDMKVSPPTVLVGMDLAQLTELVKDAGQSAFRAKQVYRWIYKLGARDFECMTNLAKPFRAWLDEHCVVGLPAVLEERRSTEDETVKLLIGLADGCVVESVLMRERDWWTVCVSSQVGCAMGCAFCTTGMGGFRRNLTCGEIVGQVIEARRRVPEGDCLRNIVFMGMGEPLLNAAAVTAALRLLMDPDGMAVAARRITVSTCGIVPELRKLSEEDLGINIAISFSGVCDTERNAIMPIGKKYPIEQILAVCREFDLRPRRRITFEYVLLGGVNDSDAHAHKLAKVLRGLHCKVNLIPYNPNPALPFKRPSADRVERFRAILSGHNFTVCTRLSKGLDVDGACGQLAGKYRGAREGGAQ